MGFPSFENSSPQSSGSGGPGGGVRLTGNASSIYGKFLEKPFAPHVSRARHGHTRRIREKRNVTNYLTGFDILNPSGGSRIVPYPSQDDYNPYGQRDQEAPSMSGHSAGSIPDANRFQVRLGHFTSYMGPEAFLDWDINEESSSGEVESASDPEPNANPGPARSQQGHIRVTRSETKALIRTAMGRTSQVIFRDEAGAALVRWDFADHSWQFYPALTLADDMLRSESRYDSSEIESVGDGNNNDDDNDEDYNDEDENESMSSSQRETVARIGAFASSVFRAIQMEQEQPAEGDRESSVARSECSSDEVEILGFTSRRRR